MPPTMSSDTPLAPIGDIPLLLADPDRAVSLAPSGVPAGLIRLGAWHITRVPRLPDSFDGYHAYLIRIPYDLDVDPDGAPPRRFEVGFTFATDGVSVHDAVPRRVSDRPGNGGYVLDGQATFAPEDATVADRLLPDIVRPVGSPGGQLSGVGTAAIRWRLSGSARDPLGAGSHVGWIVLLVPAGVTEVRVLATASFALPDNRGDNRGDDRGLREVALPDAFTVALPAEQTAVAHRAGSGTRVFISYVHESTAHKAAVKTLSDLLRDEGDVTVILDQDESAARQDWQRWMTTGIIRSDYVLVVASPGYRSVGRYETDNVPRRGIDAEFRLLTTLLAEDYPHWLRKILPVVLPGRAVSEIPVVFQPYDADYYVIDSLTPDGIVRLLEAVGRELPP
jgi:hypothetical protein